MILLWGLSQDGPLARVRAALLQRQVPFYLLNQRHILDTGLTLESGDVTTGTLSCQGKSIALERVTAVYVRPYNVFDLPVMQQHGSNSPAWRHAYTLESTLLSWCDITDALVINRPAPMASNYSKPYQALFIRDAGFAIPDSLITTDPAAARDFWEQHGEVVYKSISGVRSVVSRLTPDHLPRWGDITWCPTQFQEYVPGTDYRVHVVGNRVFASEIVSRADDYRYAHHQGTSVHIRACDLPADCAARCIALSTTLGLPVSGIDLRRTPDDRWYCFEVNPSPGFSYYQEATDQPIAETVARLLAQGY